MTAVAHQPGDLAPGRFEEVAVRWSILLSSFGHSSTHQKVPFSRNQAHIASNSRYLRLGSLNSIQRRSVNP